jgi:phosphoglycolate phosphatase
MATIVFDLDGTIADSFDYVVDFLAREKHGHHLNFEDKQQYYGLSMFGMARKMGHPWWRLLRLLFKGRQRMKLAMKEIQPFTGMPDVIHKLHAEGHELFIVSSNSVRNIHKFLHQHKLHTYFLQVYGGIGIFGKAPALRRLFKDQNLDIKNGIYIGDEMRDVQAAQSIGLKVVAVSWGFASPHSLADLKPTKLVNTPSELLQVLEDL